MKFVNSSLKQKRGGGRGGKGQPQLNVIHNNMPIWNPPKEIFEIYWLSNIFNFPKE